MGKRKYRELEERTKRKISQSLKNKPKSEEHKRAISESMKEYWKTIPNKQKQENVS